MAQAFEVGAVAQSLSLDRTTAASILLLSLSLSILFVFDVIKAVGNLIIASAAGRDSALFHSRA